MHVKLRWRRACQLPLDVYADFLSQLPGSSDTAASFAFEREDHTLGNALRYMIMKKYAAVTETQI